MATMGHTSKISIKNYSRRCPSRKRREMYDVLSEIPKKRSKTESTSTLTSPSSNNATEPNFDLTNAELKTINSEDLSDIFQFDDEIEMPQVLDILTQIEKENESLQVTKASPQKTTNVSLVPTMHFPHSNVTINYHFHNN